jgi:branched-chain amino acid transport system permease protein
MDFVAFQLLNGLSTASTLFLVSVGLTVIFGVTRVVNFAHGSLAMLGAYLAFSILSSLPRDPASFILGIVLASAAVAAVGVFIEISLLRRIYRAPELLQLLATFGVVLMVEDLTQWIWGAADLALPRPRWLRSSIEILGSRFPSYDLALIFVSPVVLGCLWLLFTRTRWGTLLRAATGDRDMVAALGVDQRRLFTTVFALGAGLAGLGGALALPDGSANLQMDLSLVTDAFVVVVIGGLGSVAGAFLASILIGELQALGIVLLPQSTLVLVFAVMAIVLVVRPNGLLGRAATSRGEVAAVPVIRAAPMALKIAAALALACAIAAPLVVGPFMLSVLTEAAIAILFAVSLHFVMGPGGMPSFGHAAWFGIGAYGAALATKLLTVPMPIGMLLATIAAGVVALAFATVVVRLSGVYLAMLTLAFAQIVWAIAFQASSLTGGDNGTLGVWPDRWAADPRVFYWLALALCVGAAMFLRVVLFAPFGYALRATRDSEQRAEAIGLDTARIRLFAFAIAGAAAGLAGGLSVYSKGSVFPSFISITRSVDGLVMVLLGGVQTLAGPIVGAVVYTGLFDTLLVITDYWRFALGAVIVLLVIAFPQGIAGATRRLWLRGHEG